MIIDTIDRDSLVDIQSVSIDDTLPKDERIRDYIRQIKNPYLYRHGKYVVKIAFADTDVTLEQRLIDYIRAKCAVA
ncbi:MAG: hypothetical protein LUE06_07465 [Oscillospiraceae bacterium]|nr:hypothetical protein [Oscillospiraceae bacterium]MCD8374453.1 hypothetical protein [Oscillospiraceae bacterium]